MGTKAYLIIASYFIAIMAGWHGHTWYDGYLKSKEQTAIIDNRVIYEKNSNEDAAVTAKKENDDDQKAQTSDAVVEEHIEASKSGYDCVVPNVSVLDLQQAVTSHTRAGKPNPSVP